MKATTKDEILALAALEDDLATIAASNSAPEILACARRHLGNVTVLAAAFKAISTFWPGFFTCAQNMRRALAETDTARRLTDSPLRIVPVSPEEMEDGSTYLAASYGTTAIVARIIQGAAPESANGYQTIFRIEVVK